MMTSVHQSSLPQKKLLLDLPDLVPPPVLNSSPCFHGQLERPPARVHPASGLRSGLVIRSKSARHIASPNLCGLSIGFLMDSMCWSLKEGPPNFVVFQLDFRFSHIFNGRWQEL